MLCCMGRWVTEHLALYHYRSAILTWTSSSREKSSVFLLIIIHREKFILFKLGGNPSCNVFFLLQEWRKMLACVWVATANIHYFQLHNFLNIVCFNMLSLWHPPPGTLTKSWTSSLWRCLIIISISTTAPLKIKQFTEFGIHIGQKRSPSPSWEGDPCEVVMHNDGDQLVTKQPLADAFSHSSSGKDQEKEF